MHSSSVSQDRQTWQYRLLEGLIGYCSIGFLILMVATTFLSPAIAAVFLIIYSFLWVLKLSLNAIYTIYTYKQVKRWESMDWPKLFELMKTDKAATIKYLQEFGEKYNSAIDWQEKVNLDIQNLDLIENTKYSSPDNITHVCIFSIYNEPPEVLIRSLKCIYEAGYNLDKILVVVSQEARLGQEPNQALFEVVKKEKWLNAWQFAESDLEIVYNPHHHKLDYRNTKIEKLDFSADKLNVFFTQHPDGLIGEIKGKSSNEDWGGRHASLILKSKQVDPELVTVTSLDADSHIGKWFFHNLSYRFCLTPNRLQSGYQPVHVYSNNFFQTGFWQRQVATQSTLWNMNMLGLEGETYWFAIYSAPLVALQKIDFWVRDVIAEDYMVYAKTLAYFKGQFQVVPFYGVFEGDAVEADDYVEAILNQYKQLQRWSWGGVESFPYLFKKFFMEPNGHSIDLRVRLKHTFLLFTNHFFWSSSPILFSVGLVLPQFFGGEAFQQQPIAQNLSIFSQYFVWISYIFILVSGFITYSYIAPKATKLAKLSLYEQFLIAIQWLISPFLYGLSGLPALDAQIRGIRGKYLGYWVTPKK